MVFIDLEKAFDRVPRDLIWAALRAQKVPEIFVKLIMDMYENAQTKVKCPAGTTKHFSVQVGVHQGSVLSPFLFNIVFDYLLKNLVNEPNVTSLFFADDVAIISSSVVDLQNTLD